MIRMLLLLTVFSCQVAFAQSNLPDETLMELEAIDKAESLLREQAREAKILQSLDEFNKALDISELEQLQQFEAGQTLDDTYIDMGGDSPLGQPDLGTVDEFEDVIFDDGFEFLDDEIEALNQELDGQQVKTPKQEALKQEVPKQELLMNDIKSSKGVGVKGKEEALINELDNSDLMDFDKDLDSLIEIQLIDDEDDTDNIEI